MVFSRCRWDVCLNLMYRSSWARCLIDNTFVPPSCPSILQLVSCNVFEAVQKFLSYSTIACSASDLLSVVCHALNSYRIGQAAFHHLPNITSLTSCAILDGPWSALIPLLSQISAHSIAQGGIFSSSHDLGLSYGCLLKFFLLCAGGRRGI